MVGADGVGEEDGILTLRRIIFVIVTRAVAGGEGIPKKGHHGNLSVVGWWNDAGRVCGREIEAQGCCHDEQQNAFLRVTSCMILS